MCSEHYGDIVSCAEMTQLKLQINKIISMKKKCVNPKDYSLTESKEYDVLSSGSKYYTIKNNVGDVKNYSKDLFEEVEETTTEKEILDSLTKDQQGYNFKAVVNGKIKTIYINYSLTHSGLLATCSTVTIQTLNSLMNDIITTISIHKLTFSDLLLSKFLAKCIALKINGQVITGNYHSNRVLFSTNVNVRSNDEDDEYYDEDEPEYEDNPHYKIIEKAITDNFIVTMSEISFLNKNSTNHVSTWIINTDEKTTITM